MSAEKSAAVKAQLQKLFALCSKKDAAAAAELILVDESTDVMRYLRKTRDYSDAHDRKQVDVLVGRIAGWLECERVLWGEFLTSEESDGEWCAWEVSFVTGPDGPRRYFGFLLVDGEYRLGDIDQA
jgi:hypothetical protein